MGWRLWRFDAMKPLEIIFSVSFLALLLIVAGILIHVIIDFFADGEYLLGIGVSLLFVFMASGLLLGSMG